MVSAIGSIAGSLIGANASKQAASDQLQAAQAGANTDWNIYNQNRTDALPYINAGQNAVGSLADLIGTSGNTSAAGYGSLTQPFTMANFTEDPGYQFQLSEGQKALDRSYAAKGGLLSGAATKASINYNQNAASDEFNNAYNRYTQNQTNTYNKLAGLAGLGQTSSNQIGQQGITTANNSADLLTSGAAANAAGTVGAANAWSTGLNSLGGSLSSALMPNSPTNLQKLIYG